MPKAREKVKIPQLTAEPVINLAIDTVKQGKQAIIFVSSKRSAEATAEKIAKAIHKLKVDLPEQKELSEQILNVLSKPTVQCKRLSEAVLHNAAFHHAGLIAEQRNIIEQNFRQGGIKIICATPTLAYGVDLPAYRSIVKDLRRFDGDQGMNYIPVLEYMQMAGRAGRPKYDKYGEAICIVASEGEKEKIVDKYLRGEPEEIYSKLAVEPVLRTYILSMIATDLVADEKQLMELFSKTFWAHQFKDMDRLKAQVGRMLEMLKGWGFIEMGEEDFLPANEESRRKLFATKLGKRVAELYIDPLTAYSILIGLKKGALITTYPITFLQLISNSLEMRPLLRTKAAEWDDVQEVLNKHHETWLEDIPALYEPEYEDFVDSVKTSMFFNDWIEEKDEEALLEKYNIRPGEIRVKLDKADWLLYAAEELCKLTGYKELIKELIKLRIRIQTGAKEELLALLQLKDIGRVRARKMYMSGIKDIGAVKRVSIEELSRILGKKTGENVKKQVGQEVKESQEAIFQ